MLEFESGFEIFKLIAFIFPVIFIFVFAGIFFTLLKRLKQWNHNNKQPQRTVSAKIVNKKIMYTRHNSTSQIVHSSTSYYVTFEVDNKDTIEFEVDELTYRKTIENESGNLTYQGTRFINFVRS
jgi:Protein of unknown function (DUF2500)